VIALKWAAVFAALAALDFVWARYTLAITDKRASAASIYAAVILALGAFSVISYTTDHWLLIPACTGAFVGTYLAVWHDERKKPKDPVFSAVAHDMVKAGWSVFPRERGAIGWPRMPKAKGTDSLDQRTLLTRKPSPDELDLWVKECGDLNAGVVLGLASGNAFVIDIDVIDGKLGPMLEDLADMVFGRTRLRRVIQWPQVALVYRYVEEDAVAGRNIYLPDVTLNTGERRGQGIDIVSTGQAFTFYGEHNNSGRIYKWAEASPLLLGPEHAPVVTSEQVKAFIDAVEGIKTMLREQDAASTTSANDDFAKPVTGVAA
jgi:hypothetical protein